MKKEKIIAVAGPTASGKTALAVKIAQNKNGEVISNDSMQVYKGMEIGTAAPTAYEMGGVRHHMIGITSPDSEFSCADYAALAKKTVGEIVSRGHLPIFCGGTGLYLDSVLKVSDFSEGVKNEELRAELSEFARRHGAEALHRRLFAADPDSAAAIHPNNVRRVIRAIEIFETTGITKTEWDRRSVEAPSPYDATVIVLDFLSRELLYGRIDARVDKMMASGLEAEVRNLWEAGLLCDKMPAYQAIGYKEFIPYFEGNLSLEAVTDSIKLATRRYAKRQITWFKRYENAVFVHPDRPDGTIKSCDELFQESEQVL